MRLHPTIRPLQCLLLLILLMSVDSNLSSQEQGLSPARNSQEPSEADRVARMSVPTDALVLDRAGRFVNDLKKEQFELLVNGKPRQISFFDLVEAGSPEEGRQWSKAQGLKSPDARRSNPDGGRTLFFFVDDLHMSTDSISRVRRALLRFIDAAMGVHDRVLISSATRQIGFMQILSTDKSALRAAIEHLAFRRPHLEDNQRPVMSEDQALAIEQNDPAALAPFVDAFLAGKHDSGRSARLKAEEHVRRRAASLARQSVGVSGATLLSLIDLVRSHGDLPGRKPLFVLSDGFILSSGLSDATDRLLQTTEAAARAGIIIYAVDSSRSGQADGSGIAPSDPAGRTAPGREEIRLHLDGPRVLAAATGGRVLGDAASLSEAVTKILAETGRYYLLAWHIEPAMLQSGNSKSLKVAVKDHPEYTVRLRQTSIDLFQYVGGANTQPGDMNLDLLKAIRSPEPLTALPIFLYPGYVHQDDKGQVLQIILQIPYETIAAAMAPREERSIDVMGVVLNESGATVDSFQTSVNIPIYSAREAKEQQADLVRKRSIVLGPGVYDVRVAALDKSGGSMGSAHESIEVPQFLPGKLGLSSLYLAEPQVKAASQAISGSMQTSARRRFSSHSRLRFGVDIYNAAFPSDGSPAKIAMQAKIFRGDQSVIQSPVQPFLINAAERTRLNNFEAELSLEGLSAGAYSLEITAIDQANNSKAAQHVSFWIQ